ncbi:MAG: type II secretion system minor pseudopilin GspI [Gammaproteobacteria bacterium]
MNPATPPRRICGFTLLEILVALGIISIALLALLAAEAQANRTSFGLRERTLAHWVAMNRLTELRIARDWPATGSGNGNMQLGNLDWRWSIEVSNTQDPDLRRIEVSVARETAPDDTIIKLVGFRGRPQPRPQPIIGSDTQQ